MTTGDQGDANPHATGEDDQHQPAAGEQAAGHQDFATLLASLPWLLKQYAADSINLLETEGQLALRSLIMILALILSLAGLIAGGWLVLVVLTVYGALEAGVPAWGVVLGVVLLHVLAFAGLARQMKTLARCLAFPNSRRAFGALAGRGRHAHHHPEDTRVHAAAQERHRPGPGPG